MSRYVDRMGWTLKPVELWMALRDRRGPLTAMVLACAYLLLIIDAVLLIGRGLGWAPATALSPALQILLGMSVAAFVWRLALRFAFTAREYGWREGVRGVLRIPVSNIIAIMAGRRAFVSYVRALRGQQIRWDKTVHRTHPAMLNGEERTA